MAIINDLNFAVSTEGLDEKGKEIQDQYKIIEDALAEIEEAKKGLDSWKSRNKDLYDNRINAALPKMHEMADVVLSYGNVARQTSTRLREVENRIAQTIESDA